MIENFREAATKAYNSYVQKFKENGGKVIGLSCSFLPLREIYRAAGMLGIRLRGNEVSSTTIGDTYFGPVICSFPKCLLQMAGEGKYKFLDGLIMSTGCDAMRRLDDCWRKAGTDYDGIVPEFHYLFGIPHKAYDFDIEWFVDETRLHIKNLEKHFHVTVKDEDIVNSIKLFNESRFLMQKMQDIRVKPNLPISGTDATAVLIAGSSMPVDDYIKLMKGFVDKLDTKKDGLKGKRILLLGSVNDDLHFLKAIEDEGAVIVDDNNCFGARCFETMIEPGGDPVESLARSYLDGHKCPRMFGEYKMRLNYIKDKVDKSKIDGVILQNIRFCDLHGSENGIFERDLEKDGIPCMRLEREYGTLVETGRVKMRVQAFIERIQ